MADRLELNDRGSFLDDENQMVVDAEITSIGEQLFEDWNNSNLDEGTFWADYQFALMCDSNYLKGRFNQFYDLTPEDDEYIEWDEEK